MSLTTPIAPDGRPAGCRRRRARLVAAVVGVCVLIPLAACGDDDNGATAGGPGDADAGPTTDTEPGADDPAGATPGDDAADLAPACDLLTGAEVEAALGMHVAQAPTASDLMCNYDVTDAVGGVLLTVQPDVLATQSFEAVAGLAGDPEPVEGIGDGAYRVADPVDQLLVARGNSVFGLSVSGSFDAEQVQRELAEAVLARM